MSYLCIYPLPRWAIASTLVVGCLLQLLLLATP